MKIPIPLSPARRSGLECRLLYLVGELGRGGVEKQLYDLLKAMDRNRYKPIVVVWNYCEKDAYVDQIRALGIPLKYFSNIRSRVVKLDAFRRLVKELRPEVVHSFSFYTNFAAWWATLGLKTISIGSIQQDFITERQDSGRILGRLSARLPVIQISNSLAAKKTAEQFTWFSKPSRIYVVRNPLDMDVFTFHPLEQNGSSVLAVGRLMPEKRWDRLLRSIALVAAKGLDFSVRLVGDGPLREQLESQARDLGVQGFVQFLGLRHDIPVLLKNSTFLLHTADAEGCPNVVMEAMGCGRAVVATDAGEVPYLVENGKTGFVVRRGDDPGLVRAIATLLTNRDLSRRMGESGRVKAEREFRLDRFVAEMLTAYREAGWEDA